MLAPALQDMQRPRNVTGLISSTAGFCTRQHPPSSRRICRRQRRGVHGSSCGYQRPQVRDQGRIKQDFQGTKFLDRRVFHHDSLRKQQFCREIIVWKHISHPNILPLLGVSFSTHPYSFRMVSPWMKNGDVMEYTRSNPSANRLQLVSALVYQPRIRPPALLTICSSPRSRWARIISTSSGLFTET